MRGPLFWIRAARAPFFTGSLAPILVGTAMAFYEAGQINWLKAALALIALVCLHAGANLANDYYDHLSGNDEINLTYATPFTGGSRLIQEGKVAPWEILVASLVSLGAGGAIGLYLVWATGWPILLLGLIGALTGFFYTAPPLKLGYRGIGEIFIFLDFGLLPVLGAYYVQTQRFSTGAMVAGVPVGLLITAILWINQFQDLEADRAVGKRHWVVRLGRRTSAWVHCLWLALTYGSILAGIAWGALPPWSALGLLSLPVGLQAGAVAVQHCDELDKLTPANAATIVTHLLTSVLMSVGIVVQALTSRGA